MTTRLPDASRSRLIDDRFAGRHMTRRTWVISQSPRIDSTSYGSVAEFGSNQPQVQGTHERPIAGIGGLIGFEYSSGVESSIETPGHEDAEFAESDTQPKLAEALEDLREITEEAEEKEYQLPTVKAVSTAKRLLETMYEIAPQRFEVYPMPEGEITIDATKTDGDYLLMIVESDGAARSLTNIAGGRSRRYFNSIDDIPREFLRESMVH